MNGARPTTNAGATRAENARYRRRVTAGLTKLNVLVPLVRLGEFDALLVQSREQARATQVRRAPGRPDPADPQPLCRTLRIKLPVSAFGTRLTAQAWLQQHLPRLEGQRPEAPCHRAVT